MIQNVGRWRQKIGSKKLDDGVKKMLDQRWRRKFPLLSPRRSHNWRRSIKENDPRAAATKMSSHNVQTPDTCLMSDVYHHLIARLIIIQVKSILGRQRSAHTCKSAGGNNKDELTPEQNVQTSDTCPMWELVDIMG